MGIFVAHFATADGLQTLELAKSLCKGSRLPCQHIFQQVFTAVVLEELVVHTSRLASLVHK